MKRTLCVVLACAMLFVCSMVVFAADVNSTQQSGVTVTATPDPDETF